MTLDKTHTLVCPVNYIVCKEDGRYSGLGEPVHWVFMKNLYSKGVYIKDRLKGKEFL